MKLEDYSEQEMIAANDWLEEFYKNISPEDFGDEHDAIFCAVLYCIRKARSEYKGVLQ